MGIPATFFSPIIDEKVRKHLKPTNDSWRMDETYLKIKGKNEYLYRAVDSEGNTIDFFVSEHRDKDAAKKFFKTALRQVKYLSNIIEQDHRFIKRKVEPMLGFDSFKTAEKTICGIEIMHMIRKGQVEEFNLPFLKLSSLIKLWVSQLDILLKDRVSLTSWNFLHQNLGLTPQLAGVMNYLESVIIKKARMRKF